MGLQVRPVRAAPVGELHACSDAGEIGENTQATKITIPKAKPCSKHKRIYGDWLKVIATADVPALARVAVQSHGSHVKNSVCNPAHCLHRSHFGSRYTKGCCGNASLVHSLLQILVHVCVPWPNVWRCHRHKLAQGNCNVDKLQNWLKIGSS